MTGYQGQSPEDGQQYPQGGANPPAGGQYPQGGEQQNYQQGGGLPNAPAYQQQYGQAPPSQPMPSTIQYAWILMIVTAVIGVISAILLIADKNKFIDQVRKNSPGKTTAQYNTTYNAAVAFVLVVGIVFGLLYVFFAWKIRQGRGWARIVVTVLLVLGILGGISNVASSNYGGLAKVLGVIGLLLDIAVLVLVWLRPSSDYFKSVKAQQQIR